MARLANANGMPRHRSVVRDASGHRTLTAVYRVQVNQAEGPISALYCPGLPLPGRMYAMDDESDPWMYATFNTSAAPAESEAGRVKYYDVSQEFTTKPFVNETGAGWPGTGGHGGGGQPGGEQHRCNEQDVQNPLLEPNKINGSTATFTEQGLRDRFDQPIQNSAHQLFEGPKNEWDNNRPQFTVEQNWPLLEFDLCTSMVDCVNELVTWDFPQRSVKLSRFNWRLNRWGLCYFYFTRIFEFEVRIKTVRSGTGTGGFRTLKGDWDRKLKDVGTKVLKGRWIDGNYVIYPMRRVGGAATFPDVNNPNDFVAALDQNNNPVDVTLNGAGLPAGVKYRFSTDPKESLKDTGPAHYFDVQKYDGVDFHLLGL